MIKESVYGKFALRQFSMQIVSGMNDQQRPMLETNIDEAMMRQVKQFVSEHGADYVLARTVAHELGGLLSYGKTMLSSRPIANGWQAKRCFWRLDVDVINPMGIEATYIVSGYTNKVPELKDDVFNWDDVVFYVNSTVTERRVQARTAEGPHEYHQLTEVEHVIADLNYEGVRQAREVRTAPVDMLTNFTVLHLGADSDLLDARTMITATPVTVERRHVVPSRYLAELMSVYFKATSMDAYAQSEDQIVSQARASMMPRPIAYHPLFSALAALQGQPFNGAFTYKELVTILPSVVKRGTVLLSEVIDIQDDTPVGACENQVLVYLGQTVPALIQSMGIGKARFHVQMPYHEEHEPLDFRLVDTHGFAGNRMASERWEHMQGIMQREIFPEVRRMGCAGGTISFEVNVFGVTTLRYEMLFGERCSGVRHFASYADALTTPLTTDTRERSMALAADLHTVLTTAADIRDEPIDYIDPFAI